ncbi:MAG: thioredoxin family protein [Planctomycetia bacterium]|nr:thioredoxin family protein [Planctomycetia bacterium]
MQRQHLRRYTLRLLALLALGCFLGPGNLASDVRAQAPGFQPLNLSGNAEPTGPVVTAKGAIIPAADGKTGRVSITAQMTPGWHIYSTTQPPGGPVRTKIKLPPSADYKIGEFVVVQAPHTAPEPAFDNLVVETHDGEVTWNAPIELSPGVDLAKLAIAGSVLAQACSNVCLPPQDYPFTLKLAGAPTSEAPASFAPPTPSTSTIPSTGPPMPTSFAPPSPNTGLPAGISAFTQPAAPTSPATSASTETYKPDLSHITLSGELSPTTKGLEGKAAISFRAESAPEWHVYITDTVVPKLGNQPTLIVFSETSGLKIGKPTADQQPIAAHEAGQLAYFEKPVTWTSEIEIPAGTKPGAYRLAGAIGFQTCKSDAQCDRPSAVKFEATLTVGPTGLVDGSKVRFTEPENYRGLAKLVEAATATALPTASDTPATATTADPLANIQIRSDEAPSSLPYMLMIGFFAGLILNFMPCVLPVIGLKVLSFVEQSGHDRKKILMLNVWYALGMLSVFWVLAAIPIVLRVGFNTSFGWGQQFSYDGFTISLVAIVFVMALSFLGVWEIPIPGFAGSGNAQKLASKEGAGGAFFKGIITTILATPCSGPGLAAAVGFALRESAPVTFAIFTAMGLGMASPYLAIGLQPSLLRFLPKPGEWMDTFKQVMGFVLLATVVWLLTSLPIARLIPTITLIFGLWAGCWWIGRTPVYAELPQKLKAWAGATVWSLAIGWFAFSQLQGIIDYRVERYVDAQIAKRTQDVAIGKSVAAAHTAPTDAINWQHLSMPQLQTAFASNQTVLVDFTADWCATCKLLKSLYLDKPETKQLFDQLGVVPFEADMTSPPQELTDLLRKLNPSGGVPVIAIFPAGDPSRPIVFADGYTQTQIFEALRKAGPSKANDAPPKLGMR